MLVYGGHEDIVIEDFVTTVDEQNCSPDPQHKEGLLARMWRRIVDSYAAQYDGATYPFS